MSYDEQNQKHLLEQQQLKKFVDDENQWQTTGEPASPLNTIEGASNLASPAHNPSSMTDTGDGAPTPPNGASSAPPDHVPGPGSHPNQTNRPLTSSSSQTTTDPPLASPPGTAATPPEAAAPPSPEAFHQSARRFDSQRPAPRVRQPPVIVPPAITQIQPAVWQEREPEDQSHAVDHVSAFNKAGAEGWRITGASRRGKMHAHEGSYREDSWNAEVSLEGRKWNIIAVADGGGSYKLSRIGAREAVQTAVATLVTSLPPSNFTGESISKIMEGAFNAAYMRLEQQATELAETNPAITVRDLSTTLLIVAHCPAENIVCVGQVGDGLIALQKEDGEPVALGGAESGQVAGETVFLNNVKNGNWRERIKYYKIKSFGRPQFLVAMTDGVGDDAIETPKNFRMLFEMLAQTTRQADPATAILEWLNYEKRGSFEDRTLAVIYPEDQES
jgi:hypothetical protein